MNAHAGEMAVVGAGFAYLAALSWAIGNVSYDIWGALILVPIYGALGVAGIRWAFRGSLRPVAQVLCWGLLLKLGGAAGRYWVGFEAYGGSIDAGRYHEYAVEAVGLVRSGEASFTTVLPSGQGTAFLENFTAFVYALTGGSQLAGFVTFSFLAYVGLIFIVKAAITAVPGLAARRYAWFCVLFPSVVYWPSSIGKEAPMMLGLGVATYGIARMLTRRGWVSSLVITGCGLGFAAIIRPHIAGIWVAAALPGLVVALVARSRSTGGRKVSRFGILLVIGVALIVFGALATATVEFLAPASDDETSTTGSLTQILEETTRRTAQAGSSFTPPSVSSPLNWPYASLRTLTRPLPFEVQGVAQLISAAEMTALLGIYALSRKRIRNLPRLIVSNPYITFVVTALFLVGLAYTSLANLGILTRQKSLIMPFLLLLPCVPSRSFRAPQDTRQSESGTSERRDDSLVGVSAGLTPPDALAIGTRSEPRSESTYGTDDDLWT